MGIKEKLILGNQKYLTDSNQELREQTAINGQNPYAIIVCCSDSRVIPEQIFSASIGDLFVIRIAGNVLDKHQLGSIKYAAAHLNCKLILLLGHTGCGAISAALRGHSDGFISYITEDILGVVGEEKNPDRACQLNVQHGVDRIKKEFNEHPEMPEIEIRGAVYDIRSGVVEWLP